MSVGFGVLQESMVLDEQSLPSALQPPLKTDRMVIIGTHFSSVAGAERRL